MLKVTSLLNKMARAWVDTVPYPGPHFCSSFHSAILRVSARFSLMITKWLSHHILTPQYPKAGNEGSSPSIWFSFYQGVKSFPESFLKTSFYDLFAKIGPWAHL